MPAKSLLERIGLIERLWGRQGLHNSLYMTRVKLTPTTRWGGLYLHIFHRGDADPDPHDHPWEFWTFPLVSYFEMRMSERPRLELHHVEALRLHHRPAGYAHRVLGPVDPAYKRIATLVWHGPGARHWGFWVTSGHPGWDQNAPSCGSRRWVHWRNYLFWKGPEA